MRTPTLRSTALAAAAVLVSAGLAVAVPIPATAAPAGIEASVTDSWCLPDDDGGDLGAAIAMTEKGKRGVVRMSARWTATDLSTDTVTASKTKRSKKFADTAARHTFKATHGFDLAPGTYELKVNLTWQRSGKNWRRSAAGTCDLTVPPEGPPAPPPNLPPPPPPVAEPTTPARVPAAGRRNVTGSTGQAMCQSGGISALAPGVTTDRDEYVWWLTEIWWWNPSTQTWYVDSQSDYAYARAVNGAVSGSGGIMQMAVWRSYPDHNGVSNHSFTGMAPGSYYTTVNWFWTESGGWAGYFADHGGGAWYCYLG